MINVPNHDVELQSFRVTDITKETALKTFKCVSVHRILIR